MTTPAAGSHVSPHYPTPRTLPGPEPTLLTKLPGPKAAALIARDAEAVSPSYTRSCEMVMEYGEGIMARDVDGNIFLDMGAGIAVTSTGHRHPQVVAAIKAGLDSGFVHMSGTDFYYPSQIVLAERLAASGNPNKHPRRVFFCNSGTEANEAALKLARWKTGRTDIVSMWGAFHGRTYGSLSLGTSKAIHRQRFGPFLPGIHHMPYPDPYRGLRPGQTPDELAAECLRHLTHTVFKKEVEPTSVAAVFVEPVQGEGGYIVPPKSFLTGLRDICTQHGILLVCDEVQSGGGRTGKMWAHEHSGIHPDIVTWAKGIASGLPLGAVIASKEVMSWPPGTHASTFGGNPLACRAAIATLDLLEGGLIYNSRDMGAYLLAELKKVCDGVAHVGDVRGVGLMIAVDFVKDKKTKEADRELRNRIEHKCFENGLIVLACGESNLRFCPALIVTKEDCDVAVRLFGRAIRSV